ncbi:MAG: ATP synthase gamma chain [Parcubacteria group bacterium GW2011_GWC1_38_6]|nr:MAG: ATP synthase gamma chain [Parcubacteria group bacterium GW2011_GWC1_38_6]
MASLSNLKKQISGVRGIGQIMTAMELVAATKMRKSQEVALRSRFYAFEALEMLGNIANFISSETNSFISQSDSQQMFFSRETKKTMVLLVTSDKGLVGSFNSAVIKKLDRFLKDNQKDLIDGKFVFAAIGQKGVNYLQKRGFEPVKAFSNYSDIVNLEEVIELADTLKQGYESNQWDRIISFSTNFTSVFKQDVVERQILPFNAEHIRKTIENIIPDTGKYSELKKEIMKERINLPMDYIVEPSPQELLNNFLPHLLRIQIYHLMLEANASEHSSRRMTMKNASDNAKELTDNLTLTYNKSRQELITRELTEMAGTMAAINN